MPIEKYLQAVPKAELHLHLEGAIRPATLLTLAQRNNVALPADTVEGLKRWFVFRDFGHFAEVFQAITSCLQKSEDYELITYELGAELARQNVRYAEITFTPSSHFRRDIPHNAYFKGLSQGRERVWTDFNLEINWIFDIARSTVNPATRFEFAELTTNLAIQEMQNGVVALGLGGMEEGYPAEDFAKWFDKARNAGLHSVPHAGETVGPVSIWAALRELGAERIGHGVRAVEDPELVKYLAQHQVPLEVCPTSNLCLGVYPSVEQHSLRFLQAAGVIITINSDDPALFNTNLNAEVALLSTVFGFNIAVINDILLNGVRKSFLPPERKRQLAAEFQQEMTTLITANF